MKIITCKEFSKNLLLMKKRGHDLKLLFNVIEKLANNEKLETKYKVHKLKNANGIMDCHIKPDWVLLYKIEDNKLFLLTTGTHSDLKI